MPMQLSPDSQAILLLTMRFSAAGRGKSWAPLTPLEYGRFALWLQSEGWLPRDLLSRPKKVLQDWPDPTGKVPIERLEFLLDRGVAMGVALEKWDGVGIWVLTRADAAYPRRLKSKLGTSSPAVLLGVGEPRLLSTRGVAIVGSRGLGAQESAFTESVARVVAGCGFSVISGGAKGTDEIAMTSALGAQGTVVGVLAAGLMREATAKRWRQGLRSGSLCLVSTFYPEAPFQVGNAMARNKYVYALAEAGVVVRSDRGRGGTWSGATEALKKGIAPVFVNPEPRDEGCAALVELGARPFLTPEGEPLDPAWLERRLSAVGMDGIPADSSSQVSEDARTTSAVPTDAEDPYQEFVQCVIAWIAEAGPLHRNEIIERSPGIPKGRIKRWLDQAVAEGGLHRPTRLAVYERRESGPTQVELF